MFDLIDIASLVEIATLDVVPAPSNMASQRKTYDYVCLAQAHWNAKKNWLPGMGFVDHHPDYQETSARETVISMALYTGLTFSNV